MMQDKVYIMRFGEEIDPCWALLHPVFKERVKSIENQIKRRAGMAAALLFQYAVNRVADTEMVEVTSLEVIETLQRQEYPSCLPEIHYGPQGKPYVKEHTFCGQPFYFNLSHSEDVAACVISSTEVGIDIQKCKDMDYLCMARRFFAPEEVCLLETSVEAERKRLFYRLWTCKEAYGKMTGQGVSGYLNKNMMDLMMASGCPRTSLEKVVCEETSLREFAVSPDFLVAICKKADKE